MDRKQGSIRGVWLQGWGGSDRENDRECEASGIKTSDTDYDEKRADSSEVTREKFLAATFLLGADRRQCGGIITQLRKYYAKGQQTHPATVQKFQSLLTTCEGDKSPVHGSNEGLSFANVVNNNDGNRGDARDGDARAGGGHPSRSGATETHRCYYCKKEVHLKPDCLKLKAKWLAKEYENTAANGATKAVYAKEGSNEHAHRMLVG